MNQLEIAQARFGLVRIAQQEMVGRCEFRLLRAPSIALGAYWSALRADLFCIEELEIVFSRRTFELTFLDFWSARVTVDD
jgi:hypothetical protein